MNGNYINSTVQTLIYKSLHGALQNIDEQRYNCNFYNMSDMGMLQFLLSAGVNIVSTCITNISIY